MRASSPGVDAPPGHDVVADRAHVRVGGNDQRRDRVIVFGGKSSELAFPDYFNDVWMLSLSGPGAPAWTPLTTTGARPGPRWAHSAIYDPVHDRMVVYSGADDHAIDDLWALNLSGPPPGNGLLQPALRCPERAWDTAPCTIRCETRCSSSGATSPPERT